MSTSTSAGIDDTGIEILANGVDRYKQKVVVPFEDLFGAITLGEHVMNKLDRCAVVGCG